MSGLIFTGLFLKACEDNPASSNEIGEHAPAVGYNLYMGDEILLSFFRGEFDFDPDGQFPELIQDGTLVLNQSNTSVNSIDNLRIRWVDRNEVIFDLAEYGEESGGTAGMPGEYNLQFVFVGESGGTQPEEDHPVSFIYDKEISTWTFDIQMIQSGTTSVRFNLYHIDHPDYEPAPLPIQVEM